MREGREGERENLKFRVLLKKVFHKRKKKMQEKMKMAKQNDEKQQPF